MYENCLIQLIQTNFLVEKAIKQKHKLIGTIQVVSNRLYWDMTEFSDFFFQYVMNQFGFIGYRFEISIALSSVRILVYVNSTFRREITCY